MKYTIKNQSTGEYLTQYEFHRYSLAEHTAITLTRRSREEGKSEKFIAVESGRINK